MSRASRVNWSFGQIDKLRKAIQQYNRVIDKLDKLQDFNVYDDIPLRTNLLDEMERLQTVGDLSERIQKLKKISNPEQQEMVVFEGKRVPRYQAEEIEFYLRENNARRKSVRDSNYNWETMTPQQRAVAEARGNVGELKGSYYSGQDLKDLETQYYYETDERYMSVYISEWENYCVLGDDVKEQVIEDIRWIVENKPGTLRKVIERGLSETQINYIYKDSTDKGLNVYKRHEIIMNFWRDVRNGEYD